jgi:hypothetical protein
MFHWSAALLLMGMCTVCVCEVCSVTVQLAALQNLALAEAAQAAAWNEYETVALRNEHDIQGCVSKAVGEAQHKVLVWAESQATAADCETAAWLRVARSLGADPAAVTALEAV